MQTFTGDLSTVIKTDGKGSVVDWEKLMKTGLSSGTVSLVASTKIEFDGDSNTFYETNITADMSEKHSQAVTAAQTFRKGLLTLFKTELNFMVKPKKR